jgi:serine/threonine-protein kinase
VAPAPPADTGLSRPVVVLLAVLLGLLVLLCSGVISYRLASSDNAVGMSEPSLQKVPSRLHSVIGRDVSWGTPYRQGERVVLAGGVTR